MVLEYEAALLGWFKRGISDLEKIEYSINGVEPLYNLSPVLKYPSVTISREINSDTLCYRSFDLEDGESTLSKMWVLLQEYKAYVYMATAVDSINMMIMLRRYFEQCPYNCVKWNNTIIPIGMRFHNIAIEEQQDGDDKKGARRAVVLSWQSSLPLCGMLKLPTIKGFKIRLNGDIVSFTEDGVENSTSQNINNIKSK